MKVAATAGIAADDKHLSPVSALEKMQAHWSLPPAEPGLASVIVPAYNQERFLAETLQSVIGQTYRPLECIVVDDGSMDGTAAVAAKFERAGDHNLQIKCLRQTNQGAQAARNAGVLASRGEFIQYLDGDDPLDPGKLKRQIDFLASVPGRDMDVVYGDACWLIAKGDEFQVGEKIGLGPVQDILTNILVSMLGLQFNPPFSYLCRRTAVQACGPWNLNTPINQDYEYFLGMACRGFRFHYQPGVTGYYRKHSGPRISDQGLSLRIRTTLEILKAAENVAETARMLDPVRRRSFARAFRELGNCASGMDRRVWKESLEHSLRLCPDLQPDKFIARVLQRILGVWTSESLLDIARRIKRNLRRAD